MRMNERELWRKYIAAAEQNYVTMLSCRNHSFVVPLLDLSNLSMRLVCPFEDWSIELGLLDIQQMRDKIEFVEQFHGNL